MEALFKPSILRDFACNMAEAKAREGQFVGHEHQCHLLRETLRLDGYAFVDMFTRMVVEVTGTDQPYDRKASLPRLGSVCNASGQVMSIPLQPSDMDHVAPLKAVELYQAWRHVLGNGDASATEVWFAITLRELRSGNIGAPWWLLAKQSRTTLDKVRKEVGDAVDNHDKSKIDQLIRTLMRRLAAGATAYRGQPALFTNCSLAKAFWIGKLANAISISELDAAEVLATHWYPLSDAAFSTRTKQDAVDLAFDKTKSTRQRAQVDGVIRLRDDQLFHAGVELMRDELKVA